LVFTRDKQGYPADIIIDDKPNLDWTQQGAHNLLFDRPSNEDLSKSDILPHRYTRDVGWQAVLDYVDDVAGNGSRA